MEKIDYEILTDAKEVAGMRNPGKGKKIPLTALQAEHPLRTGQIALPEKKQKA